MSVVSAVLVVSGIACLAVSGVLLYFMLPREGRAAPKVSALGETGSALGQFILMVGGVALLIKGLA